MTIAADEGRGGSQEVQGGVGDSSVLIYAARLLEGCVNENGSRSNPLEIQAAGISRRVLLSPDAMDLVTRSSPVRVKGGWWR